MPVYLMLVLVLRLFLFRVCRVACVHRHSPSCLRIVLDGLVGGASQWKRRSRAAKVGKRK